ncbi:UbiA prenyltransferase family-domain-containing protein [Pavlovales sp. CCMP2436]|nr:UbiA prenyltransferase family-domain-containing protein [Pavlovales sp. CCMP2436]
MSTTSSREPPRRPVLTARHAFLAMRPWSFPVTVSSVALGVALAYRLEGALDWRVLLLTLLITVPVHAAGNLLNTYFDFKRGCDGHGSSDLTLVNGQLAPAQVFNLAVGCLAVSAVAMALLAACSPLPLASLLAIYALGVLGAVTYTGGPGFKYVALGDVLIVLTFGPVLVLFAFAVQSGHVSLRPLLLALPPTVHVEAVLHGNNLRDMKEDARSGVRTLALLLGRKGSELLYAALVLLPFAMVLAQAATVAPTRAAALVTLPLAAKLLATVHKGVLVDLPRKTAGLQFAFGMTYVASLVYA